MASTLSPSGVALSPSAFRDIHGIINLDEISKLFTRMLHRIDQQDHAITSLKQNLTAFVELRMFQGKISAIESSIGSIETKMARIHAASTSKVLDKE